MPQQPPPPPLAQQQQPAANDALDGVLVTGPAVRAATAVRRVRVSKPAPRPATAGGDYGAASVIAVATAHSGARVRAGATRFAQVLAEIDDELDASLDVSAWLRRVNRATGSDVRTPTTLAVPPISPQTHDSGARARTRGSTVRRVLELHDDDLLADLDAELLRGGARAASRAPASQQVGTGDGIVGEETPGADRPSRAPAGACAVGAALSTNGADVVAFGGQPRVLATPASTALQDEGAPSAAPSTGAALLRSPASLCSALRDQRDSDEGDTLCAVGVSPAGTPSPLRTPEPASAAPLPRPQLPPSLPPTLVRSSDAAVATAAHAASSPASPFLSSVSFTVSASRATLEGAVRRAAAVRALLDSGAADGAPPPQQAHFCASVDVDEPAAGFCGGDDTAVDVALATDTTVWLAPSDDECAVCISARSAGERLQPVADALASESPAGAKPVAADAPDNAAAVRLAALLAAKRVREQLAVLIAMRHRRRTLAVALQGMREVWRAGEARVDALRASLHSGVRLRALVAWRSAARMGAEGRRVRREHARIQQMVRHVASRRASPARRRADAAPAPAASPAPAHDSAWPRDELPAAEPATVTATAAASTVSELRACDSPAAAMTSGAVDTSLDASLPAATIAAPRVTIVVGRALAAPSPSAVDAGARRPPRPPAAGHAQTPMEQRAAARRAAREQLVEAYELAQQRKSEERRAAEEAAELARVAERRAAAAEAARLREEQRQALEEVEQRRARRRAAWAAACAHDRQRLLRGAAGWAAWRALVRDSCEHFQRAAGALMRRARCGVLARWREALWRARGRRAAEQCAAIGAARGVWVFLRMRDALRLLRRAVDERRRSEHAADAFHAMSRARHALSRWRYVVRAQLDAETAALVGAQRALHQRLARNVLRGWRQALRELVRVKERKKRTDALLARALAYYDAAMRK